MSSSSMFPAKPSSLPDVAHDAAALARPLDWVGMEKIALPVRIHDAEGNTVQVAASVDVAVDLQDATARGIHMSRLYLQLQEAFASEAVTPPGLRRVLQGFIESQAGLSSRARLHVRYEHLLLRPALESGHAGWKRYPVEIEAELAEGHFQLALKFSVEYSSTCPASAALSRQLNAERFADDFAAARPLSTNVVRDWLASERGLAATPHAQRSRAEVRVELRPAFEELPLVASDRCGGSRPRHPGADRGQARGRTGVRGAQCGEPDVLRRRGAPRGGSARRSDRVSSASTSTWRISRACTRTMRWHGSAGAIPTDSSRRCERR